MRCAKCKACYIDKTASHSHECTSDNLVLDKKLLIQKHFLSDGRCKKYMIFIASLSSKPRKLTVKDLVFR